MMKVEKTRGSPVELSSQAGGLIGSLTRPASGQKRKLSNALPPPEVSTNPADLVPLIFKENGFDILKDPSLVRLEFVKPTEAMVKAYRMDIVRAVRSEDLTDIRRLHASGTYLQCCNRFGESILHMACRRGATTMVRFLLEEAKVSLLVRDDYGRTPLHDACWTSEPNFELVKLIIKRVPELMCVKDVRGHIPINYVRKEHWEAWRSFLKEHTTLLQPKPKSQESLAAMEP